MTDLVTQQKARATHAMMLALIGWINACNGNGTRGLSRQQAVAASAQLEADRRKMLGLFGLDVNGVPVEDHNLVAGVNEDAELMPWQTPTGPSAN